ncbi:PAS domain S-box protein [Flavobacterium sp. H122]|uniref:PAS domain S-box protein n=1 Tax=Flavobacterium sp. H122 TaxID=2529860 RepID=UPI0010AB1B8D|nr:PAS domain S-box protein [Flavobacterium sp. H122]
MNPENKISQIINWFLSRPKTSGWIVFCSLLSLLSLVVFFKYQIKKENDRNEMDNILAVVKKNIEQNLKNNYAAVITIALSIDDSGQPKNFEKNAERLIKTYDNIDAIQLVPNGIIKMTYPIEENKSAIGFDILNSPLHRKAALKAIESKTIYFSGPVELKQGGLGVVGRLPVFKKGKFWGFSAVIIKFNTFIKSIGLNEFKKGNYYFQLSKINPITNKTDFFLNNKSDFSDKFYRTVDIPEGDWKLYIISTKNSYIAELLPISIIGSLLSALCGLFVLTLLKRPSELHKLVEIQKQKLIKSEFLFKSIFENAGLGIIHTDTVTGQCIDANEKICQLLGYTTKELKQMNFMMLTHPDDLQEDLNNMNKLRKGEIKQFSMEKRYFHKNGQTIWVSITVSPLWDKNEEPTHHIAIIEDISVRKEVQRELLESKQNIKDLIDSIDGIVWEGNSEEPGITFISRKSKSILGYTPEEWIADDYFWRKIIHPEDREWVIEFSIKSAREQIPFDQEYRIISKNGNIVWVRDLVSIYYTEDNKVRFRGILIDITKSKQFEIDLNNSLKLVTEQNKRLLNFSHIVSHNLRSHTSNIESLINLIEISEDEEEQKELISLLKSVSDNLNQTMDNLNEVVSIQTDINPVIENLSLNKYIEKTQEVLRNQIIKNDAVIHNNVAGSALVHFNPAYLESVLLNLLSNAIRYRHPDRKPEIFLNFYTENNHQVLEIKDNGIGIDLKKNHKKLFGLYKTFTTNPESRGIGLFISKNQIDAMKGKIEVESTLQQGTTFKIYFNNAAKENIYN